MATENVAASPLSNRPEDNLSLAGSVSLMQSLLECADAKIVMLRSAGEGDSHDQLVSISMVVRHCAKMAQQIIERIDAADVIAQRKGAAA